MNAWDARAVSHFHRRAAFGASRGTLEQALHAGREATLATLLDAREPEPALEAGIESLLGLNEIEHLQAWWMAQILSGRRPLAERVALMWHDHFATSNDKVRDVRAMHQQLQLLRWRGLGDFRELLHALARDPAMLIWLDGVRNEKEQPNENFAREVMELFGLGIGQYDEQDVAAAARALTGWRVVGREATFDPRRHDAGEQSLFGRAGVLEAADVIERILEHPACAPHIARRLLQEFLEPQPSAAAVERWARELVAVEWNVERFLEHLLASDEFLAPSALRARIAGPVELAANSILTLEAHLAPRAVSAAVGRMGQSLLRPPSVKGWDGGRQWIHAGHWLARHEALTKLAFDESVDLQRALAEPGERRALPDACLQLFLPGEDCPRLRQGLLEAAESAATFELALRECVALTLTSPHHHLA